jgi:hypothetical protein
MAKSKTENSTTLAIIDQPGNAPRKITKIIPYKKGGFAILVPYHSARRGYLAKYTVDYRKTDLYVCRSAMTEFSADDRVKLSLHDDGFVQFSGEQPGKIISGIDPLTGEPRGLGIMLENPLYKPIESGPTFGVSVWGISEFDEIVGEPSSDTIVFSEDDFYYRDCTPDSWNGYAIEGFIFSDDYWGATKSQAGRFKLSLPFNWFKGKLVVHDFTIVPIGEQSIIIGILISRFQHGFQHESGFVITSPTDRRLGGPLGNQLVAAYPAFYDDPSMQNINYEGDNEVFGDIRDT